MDSGPRAAQRAARCRASPTAISPEGCRTGSCRGFSRGFLRAMSAKVRGTHDARCGGTTPRRDRSQAALAGLGTRAKEPCNALGRAAVPAGGAVRTPTARDRIDHYRRKVFG